MAPEGAGGRPVRALCLAIAVALLVLALILATTGCERASEGTATAEFHGDDSAVESRLGDDCGSELEACEGCPSMRGEEASGDGGKQTSSCATASRDGSPTNACAIASGDGAPSSACAMASAACERAAAEDGCPSGCVGHDDGKCPSGCSHHDDGECPSDCVLHEDGKCPPDCAHHKGGECRQNCEAHATTQ